MASKEIKFNLRLAIDDKEQLWGIALLQRRSLKP